MSDVEKIGSAGIPLNIVDANGRKIMGNAYDNTAVYAVGDYCISGDHAYKCTIAIETPEDFNTNHWQQVTIEEILKEHDASIESVNASLTQKTNYPTDSNEILVGTLDGKNLYRKYLHFSNITVNVNTPLLLTSQFFPTGASNPSVSDKSVIFSSSLRLPANCNLSMIYFDGTAIYFRQAWSSSATWELKLWIEYTKTT